MLKKIDIHCHILPKEWPDLKKVCPSFYYSDCQAVLYVSQVSVEVHVI